MSAAPVLLLGVGNPDRRDDGIGPLVAARLRGALPALVEVDAGPRDVAALVARLSGRAGLLAVDAAVGAGLSAGAIRVVDPDRDRPPCRPGDPSGHALGLAEAIALAAILGERPREVRLVLVGAADLGHGEDLSPPLRSRLDAILAVVRREAEAMAGRLGAAAQGTAAPASAMNGPG